MKKSINFFPVSKEFFLFNFPEKKLIHDLRPKRKLSFTKEGFAPLQKTIVPNHIPSPLKLCKKKNKNGDKYLYTSQPNSDIENSSSFSDDSNSCECYLEDDDSHKCECHCEISEEESQMKQERINLKKIKTKVKNIPKIISCGNVKIEKGGNENREEIGEYQKLEQYFRKSISDCGKEDEMDEFEEEKPENEEDSDDLGANSPKGKKKEILGIMKKMSLG